jgi:hypothetical protein
VEITIRRECMVSFDGCVLQKLVTCDDRCQKISG